VPAGLAERRREQLLAPSATCRLLKKSDELAMNTTTLTTG
jgi:hypothetical protein